MRLSHANVPEAKAAISSTEFIRWKKVFEDEIVDRTRADWHTAILAHQIYIMPFRLFGGKSTLELEDFLLKFSLDKPEQKKIDDLEGAALEEARKKHIEESKAGWLGGLGLNKDGTKKKNAPAAMNPIDKAKMALRKIELEKKAKEKAEKQPKKGKK